MKKIYFIIWAFLIFLVFISTGCKKAFLDAKPTTAIVQPTTLDDYQGLLENFQMLYSPALPTMSADEYVFTSYASYQSAFTLTDQLTYIWAKDIFGGEITGGDWSWPYRSIFCSNNVLPGLNKLKDSEKNIERLNFLKGWALFNRAFAYFELVSNFSPAYDESSANTDLGVPLKLDPSVDDIEPRASVRQIYDQIFLDLGASIPLLEANLSQAYRNHPTKVTAHALLGRIYLTMRKYDLAELHVDSALQLYSKLIDYNTVSQTSNEPFTKLNDELIYWKTATNAYGTPTSVSNGFITINPSLLALYQTNDLRPALYFIKQSNGSSIMKVMYNGSATLNPFTGLATDELYLIKAECAARRNDLSTALKFLNDLLIKRFKTGTFTNVNASSSNEALSKILLERRKELIWRNLRWYDLKRLNKEGANITITRELNGVIYTLPPNDPKYVFPIPDNEISLSGIKQNQR
jgi:tetratricopeptide (TPR) repeat protein